jgi:hypothetical protein
MTAHLPQRGAFILRVVVRQAARRRDASRVSELQARHPALCRPEPKVDVIYNVHDERFAIEPRKTMWYASANAINCTTVRPVCRQREAKNPERSSTPSTSSATGASIT